MSLAHEPELPASSFELGARVWEGGPPSCTLIGDTGSSHFGWKIVIFVLRFSSAAKRGPWRAHATPKFKSFPLEGCLERVVAPVWPSGGVLGPHSAPRCVRQKLVPFRSCECVCVLNCNSAFACGFAFLTSVVLFPILVVLPCGVRVKAWRLLWSSCRSVCTL